MILFYQTNYQIALMMKLVIESKGIGKFSDKKINKNMFGFGKHMVTYCFAV